MPYALPADIAAYLETTLSASQQTKATTLIAAAESAIDTACNRSWSAGASHTEVFDGGHSRIFPKHAPIDEITSLKIDDELKTEDEDFYSYDSYIQFDTIPFAKRKSIELVYKASDTVPAAIKQALIRWISELMVDSANVQTPAIKRLTQGPVTVEYDTARADAASKHGLPSYVEEVVRLFRLPAL